MSSLKDQWESKPQFLLACIGSGVGLSHILRFPHACYNFGGGAYLLQYFIVLAICSVPLLYMEMAVGQLTRVGPTHAIGVGLTIVITCFLASTIYNTWIAWALHYFFNSFTNPLPWTLCEQLWNTPDCVSSIVDPSNETMMEWEEDYKQPSISNVEYFNNYVLHSSDGIYQLGGLIGSLVGYLFLAWVLCYLCIFKGVKSVEKIVYITTLMPHGILLALLVRNLTLPGSIDGLRFLFLPDWRWLWNPQGWIYASYDALAVVGLANGCLILFSSYNAKRNNIYHDTLVITAVSCITTVAAGCMVFGAYGAIAYKKGLAITDIATVGLDTMFVSVPAVFVDIPGSNVWTALYFLMVINLGISSQFPLVQVVTSSVLHQFRDKLKDVPFRQELGSLVVCVVSFIFSLMYVTQGGKYLTFFIGHFTYLPSSFLLFFEVLAICWLYGGNRLAREISFSSGHRPYYVFPFFWIFILPLVVSFLAWPSLRDVVLYGSGGYLFPVWTSLIGMLLSFFCFMWIPIGVLHELYKNGQGKSCCASFMKSVTPTFVGEHTLRKLRAMVTYDQTPPPDNERHDEAEQLLLVTSSGHQNDEIVESSNSQSSTVHETNM